jgi:hypothetical protein
MVNRGGKGFQKANSLAHLVNLAWPSATLAHENDRDMGLAKMKALSK